MSGECQAGLDAEEVELRGRMLGVEGAADGHHIPRPLDWIAHSLLCWAGLGGAGVVRNVYLEIGNRSVQDLRVGKSLSLGRNAGGGSDLLSECSSAGSWPDVPLMGPWEVEAPMVVSETPAREKI